MLFLSPRSASEVLTLMSRDLESCQILALLQASAVYGSSSSDS